MIYFKEYDSDFIERVCELVNDAMLDADKIRERASFSLIEFEGERIIYYDDDNRSDYWILADGADEEDAVDFLAAEKAAEYPEDWEDAERQDWGLPRKDGYVSPFECSECGRELNDSDISINNTFEDPDGNRICKSCYEKAGYYSCEKCFRTVEKEEIIKTADGCFCEDCASKEEQNFEKRK